MQSNLQLNNALDPLMMHNSSYASMTMILHVKSKSFPFCTAIITLLASLSIEAGSATNFGFGFAVDSVGGSQRNWGLGDNLKIACSIAA